MTIASASSPAADSFLAVWTTCKPQQLHRDVPWVVGNLGQGSGPASSPSRERGRKQRHRRSKHPHHRLFGHKGKPACAFGGRLKANNSCKPCAERPKIAISENRGHSRGLFRSFYMYVKYPRASFLRLGCRTSCSRRCGLRPLSRGYNPCRHRAWRAALQSQGWGRHRTS
jgi:hypothetical protein